MRGGLWIVGSNPVRRTFLFSATLFVAVAPTRGTYAGCIEYYSSLLGC